MKKVIRFLIITGLYESYFEESNVCLAHTVQLYFSPAPTGLVFWGFDTSMTAVK